MFGSIRKPRTLLAPLFAVAVMFGVVACGDDESARPEIGADVEEVGEGEADAGSDSGVLDFATEEDFVAFEDEVVAGEQVTVSAEVSDLYSPSILSISALEDGEPEPVLVIVEDPALVTGAVTAGAVIQVTGTVAELIEVTSFGDFDTEFGNDFGFGFDAEDEAFFESSQLDEFEGDHFIVASEVDVLDPAEN